MRGEGGGEVVCVCVCERRTRACVLRVCVVVHRSKQTLIRWHPRALLRSIYVGRAASRAASRA